ncbi:MAG: TFIIB-type zinc ribbon-containing protein [Thermofilaceae archaeon]
MFTCPECGGRAVETTEFLVCGSCGLVLSPLVENGYYGPNLTWVLFEAAEHFGLTFDECLRLYRTAKSERVMEGAALAVAIYAALRGGGEHVPLRRICEWLEARGINVSYKQAAKGLLRISRYLDRLSPFSSVKVYARKLNLDENLVKRAEEVLLKAKYLGGRDPYLIAIAAIYLAAGGQLTYYKLAKITGRSASRIWAAVNYLRKSV